MLNPSIKGRGDHRLTLRRHSPAAVLLGVASAVLVLATFLVPSTAAVAGGLAASKPAATQASGTVVGTVTVTGAPSNFSPADLGVRACKNVAGTTCSSPQLAEAVGDSYSSTLRVGTWRLQGFYVLDPFSGGALLGSATTVTVKSDAITTVDLTLTYEQPGSVSGTLLVIKIPTGVSVSGKEAIACPASSPNPNGNIAEYLCAYSGGSGTYSMTSLPPGAWILYPAYETKFGLTVGKGRTVTVASGVSKTLNLTTPYLPPTSGLVSGTASVTSAPFGFDDEAGVLACKGAVVSLSCPSLQEAQAGSSYQLPLQAGTWTLEMFYFLDPYGGLELGTPQTVTVVAGSTLDLPLTIPYQLTGTANGLVKVTGAPSNVHILDYSLLACPASLPYDGNQFDPQCASESSGVATGSFPFGSSPLGSSPQGGRVGELGRSVGAHLEMNSDAHTAAASSSDQQNYSMPLPAGKWILYPGYTTAFGMTVSTKGTAVDVLAGATSTTDLTLAYSKPTDGAVSGTTRLLNAPSDVSGLYGVEACPSPASTAPNAVCAIETQQIGPTGDYLLDVPPGTWWIAELYDYEAPLGGGRYQDEPVAGPSRELVVKAATSYVVNLSATYAAP